LHPLLQLRFQERHILAEQLQLVFNNSLVGFGGSWLTAGLVCIALPSQPGLLLWFAAYTLICTASALYVLRYPTIDLSQVGRVESFVIGVTFSGGILWGMLPWIAFDPHNIAGSSLILSVVTGIVGAALAMMSPFLPCYVIFLVAALAPFSVKLLQQSEPAYFAIGWASLVYAVAMFYFASFAQRATLAAIRLRFENAGLLVQLKRESEAAFAARDQALAANSAKSKFLTAASHDLRQPIHAMSLFHEALRRSGLLPQQQELVRNAQLASNAAREMLNTLLDFSKIEAGVVQSVPRAFYLQTLLSRLEKELARDADQKNLIYRSRDTRLVAYADPMLSAEILRNLISNAIRYTEQGGVLIGCRKRGQYAVVEVWDTGIGIPQAQTSKIFQDFYQLGNPERDRQKGLGLGLAIVKGVAKTMVGAEVTLASKPGRGSVFRLSLPLMEGAIVEDIASHELLTDFNGKRVLIIDDDTMVLAGMRALLSGWHCLVDCAESIDAALILAAAHPPDLVVIDYRLRGGHNGGEAIRALREKISPALPAIIITGDTAPDLLREASGIDAALLHKPVATSQLNAAMVSFLLDKSTAGL